MLKYCLEYVAFATKIILNISKNNRITSITHDNRSSNLPLWNKLLRISCIMGLIHYRSKNRCKKFTTIIIWNYNPIEYQTFGKSRKFQLILSCQLILNNNHCKIKVLSENCVLFACYANRWKHYYIIVITFITPDNRHISLYCVMPILSLCRYPAILQVCKDVQTKFLTNWTLLIEISKDNSCKSQFLVEKWTMTPLCIEKLTNEIAENIFSPF